MWPRRDVFETRSLAADQVHQVQERKLRAIPMFEHRHYKQFSQLWETNH